MRSYGTFPMHDGVASRIVKIKAPRPASQTRGRDPTGGRNYDARDGRSGRTEILRRGLARLAIGDNLEKDLLPLVEAVHSGAFNRADVHENILGAVIRLDESIALLAVEPLHGSFCHIALSFRYVCSKAAHEHSRFRFEIWEVISPSQGAGHVISRSSIGEMWTSRPEPQGRHADHGTRIRCGLSVRIST